MSELSDLGVAASVLRSAHPRLDARGLTDAELRALIGECDGVPEGLAGAEFPELECIRAIWHWEVST